MLIIQREKELRKILNLKNSSVGLVPTMGALHDGHLSLISRALEQNPVVVVSIYVNPTQFDRKEDLDRYPKDLEKDLKLLAPFEKQLIVYTPNHEDIYPDGIGRKKYDFGSLSKYMEGASRPGHFDGVATIVEALFKNIAPNKAYFGEKDFQQLQIIKALTKKLHLNLEIVPCPLLRDSEGLALSSRNSLLSKEERKSASVIYKTLTSLNSVSKQWEVTQMEEYFKSKVEAHDNFKVEYFNIAEPSKLIPVLNLKKEVKYRMFVSVFAGKTRLIDTMELVRK
jgi:pantoate--beta-alanine ligase